MPTFSKSEFMEFQEDVVSRPSIDTAAGIIRGVKILGRNSKNGRVYSTQALHDGARLYENVGVNISHVGKSGQGTDLHGNATVERGIGWLKNCRVQGDGVYGDLHYFKSHPFAPTLVESAQRNPNRFGLSHHAYGRATKQDSGEGALIDSINSVRSVDLVQNPATTGGLFESEGADNDPVTAAVTALFYDPELTTAQKIKQFSAMLDAQSALDAAQSQMADATGGDNADSDNIPDPDDTPNTGAQNMESRFNSAALHRKLGLTSLTESSGGRPLKISNRRYASAALQGLLANAGILESSGRKPAAHYPKDAGSFARQIGGGK